MAKQLFLNNFETVFVSYVKDAPVTGTPATELDYGVLRVSDGAAGVLLNPSNGDYYVLTAYKRSGSVESNIEVMRVTSVNNATPGECRISVERAQEGTKALGYVAGDHLALRWTRGGAENVVQYSDSRLTDSRAPTGTAGGVLSGTYPNPGFAEDMATQAEVNGALALKAPLASPTFTGTVGGITKAMVGLGNVDNTSDADKPVSTAQATAISASTATNIHAATSKTTPVDADELGLSDSAASWGLKKLTFANLKAWISSLGGAGISNTPSGNISATNVQAAINELDSEKVSKTGDTISGDVGVGVTPTASVGALQVSGTAHSTSLLAVGQVGSTAYSGHLQNLSNTSRSISLDADPTNVGANSLLSFRVDGTEKCRIDSSGNVLVTGSGGLGYGVGSGGTVAQATSKSTAVTLNKPCGRVTMFNNPTNFPAESAIPAGGEILFQVNNNLVTLTDIVIALPVAASSYLVQVLYVTTGLFVVRVFNKTGASLSEEISINFTVIKGTSS